MSRSNIPKRSVEAASHNTALRPIMVGGFAVNLVLGFVYLMMLNSLSTRGFDLEKLKNEKVIIQKEMETIDIAIAIPTSIYALESDERVQNMPKIGYRTFVEVSEDGAVSMLDQKVTGS